MNFVRVLVLLVPVLLMSAACSRDESLACVEDERYTTSASVPPLRIPDDLTIPDETDSLRVPGETLPSADESTQQPCLVSPPDFSEGSPDG